MSTGQGPMFTPRRVAAPAGIWALLFLLPAAADWCLLNTAALPHIGWYIAHAQWPEEAVLRSGLVTALWAIAAAAVAAGVVLARGRRANAPVAWAGAAIPAIWAVLLAAVLAGDFLMLNGDRLAHLIWYALNQPEALVWPGAARVVLFGLYAWLLLAVASVDVSFKRALIALLLIILLGVVFNGGGAFNKWDTHRDMLRHISRYGILACGMTLVIITGGIDLAVGSVLGLIAVVSSILCIHWGMTPWLAVPLCLLAGLACGTLSGTLISRFSIQPFIATLAMMVFARGMAKFVSGGQKISQGVQTAEGFKYLELPKFFELLNARILGDNIAVITLLFLACVAVTYILLARLRIGRYWYAIGGNEDSARLSGVPVASAKALAYALSGLFAAVAGICQAAQETQGDPEAGMTYELTAIAIVVIGGTNLMGGRGSILLTLLGTLTIGYLEKILSINAVSEAGRLMLTGAIIVTAVLLQRRRGTAG